MIGRRSIVLLAANLLIGFGAVVAQESFRDRVQQEGFGWLAGRWMATTDQGEISLMYRWELEGHMVNLDFKMGEYAYRSIIFYDPDEQRAVEVGVDNQGGRSRRTWEPQGETLISRGERIKADGETQNVVMSHSRVDAQTMKVALFGVGQNGETMPNPWATLEFKRKGRKKAGVQKKGELGRLQGTWQGTEIGGRGGSWTIIISGNKIDARGPEPESYSGIVKLNASANPKQVDFIIKKCAHPEYVGKTSLAIYKIQGKKLTFVGCEPGTTVRPSKFDGEGNARLFVLTRQ